MQQAAAAEHEVGCARVCVCVMQQAASDELAAAALPARCALLLRPTVSVEWHRTASAVKCTLSTTGLRALLFDAAHDCERRVRGVSASGAGETSCLWAPSKQQAAFGACDCVTATGCERRARSGLLSQVEAPCSRDRPRAWSRHHIAAAVKCTLSISGLRALLCDAAPAADCERRMRSGLRVALARRCACGGLWAPNMQQAAHGACDCVTAPGCERRARGGLHSRC